MTSLKQSGTMPVLPLPNSFYFIKNIGYDVSQLIDLMSIKLIIINLFSIINLYVYACNDIFIHDNI